jgi:hypothetical protein
MQTKLCRIFGKKKLPSNKKDMLGSFNIDRVVQSDCYKPLSTSICFCEVHNFFRDLNSGYMINNTELVLPGHPHLC